MMTEAVLDPDLPIIDPHHHLYPRHHWTEPAGPYLLDQFAADLGGGHKVLSTVFIECSQHYRNTGPEHLRSRGEAEFAAVIGRLGETGHFGPTRICEAIVGSADLSLGDAVDEVLEALMDSSDGRLRGIRFPTTCRPMSGSSAPGSSPSSCTTAPARRPRPPSPGVKAGADPISLWAAIRQGSVGRRRTFDGLVDEFLPAEYDPPHAAMRIIEKDLTLAIQLGWDLRVPMRFANLALADIYEALNRGWSERDCRAVMLLPQERIGVSIKVDKEKIEEVLRRDPPAPTDTKRGAGR